MARISKEVRISRLEFAQMVEALQALEEASQAGRVALLLDGKNVRKPA
jgi:chaperone required for assembly of F1-ATPase